MWAPAVAASGAHEWAEPWRSLSFADDASRMRGVCRAGARDAPMAKAATLRVPLEWLYRRRRRRQVPLADAGNLVRVHRAGAAGAAMNRERAEAERQRELDLLEAEARYYRESMALLRARLYRRGEASSARLTELQRSLERAERRLRDYRRQRSSDPAGTPPRS